MSVSQSVMISCITKRVFTLDKVAQVMSTTRCKLLVSVWKVILNTLLSVINGVRAGVIKDTLKF